MKTAPFNRALLFDCLAEATPPCLYGLGAWLLLGKILPFFRTSFALPAALAAAAVAVVSTLLYFRKGPFTAEQAGAWLDLHNQAGGRIMAGDAAFPLRVVPGPSLATWSKSLPLPLLFVIAALVVPAVSAADRVSGLGLRHELERMEEEVEAGEEAGALAEREAEALRRQLQRLRELADSRPEAVAEALSSLPGRLDAARAGKLDAVADALEKAAALREEMASDGGISSGDGDWDDLRQAIDTMEQLGEKPGTTSEIREQAQNAFMQKETPEHAGENMNNLLNALEEQARKAGQSAGDSQPASGPGPAEEGAMSRLETVGEKLRQMRMSEKGRGGAGEGDDEFGEGGVSWGEGGVPPLFGDPASGQDVERRYHPLSGGKGGGGEGMLVKRERERAPDDLPPGEYREAWRSAVDAPSVVRGGRAASAFGPAREDAVGRYFRAMREQEKK